MVLERLAYALVVLDDQNAISHVRVPRLKKSLSPGGRG
jgi:hypothetical protein